MAGFLTNNGQWMTREQHQDKYSPNTANLHKSTAQESLNQREHFCVNMPWADYSFRKPLQFFQTWNLSTQQLQHCNEGKIGAVPSSLSYSQWGARPIKTMVVSLAPCFGDPRVTVLDAASGRRAPGRVYNSSAKRKRWAETGHMATTDKQQICLGKTPTSKHQ